MQRLREDGIASVQTLNWVNIAWDFTKQQNGSEPEFHIMLQYFISNNELK